VTGYPKASGPFDAARADQRRAEIGRAVPITMGDPAFLYLTEVRGIPAATVLGCADIMFLAPPVAGRDQVDHGCVSLLRPAPDAEPTGAELAFVDALGHPAALEPARVQWAFAANGCRDAWFWAGGAGDVAYAAEGFCAKPLAILSLGLPGVVMGWGARSWLQFKAIPPASVAKIIIVADRRPA
jgi:hypothetical protein